MKSSIEAWLEQQGYAAGTVQAQMHRAGRVEDCYGDLDEHYDRDQLRSVIGELKYSTPMNERTNRIPQRSHSMATRETIWRPTETRSSDTASFGAKRWTTTSAREIQRRVPNP